jgi:hypothetical protein
MSDDDKEERARVFSRIAPIIMSFHDNHLGEAFHAEDLRQYVLNLEPSIAPDSPGRILRELRLQRRLNYVVINRRQSLYQFRPIAPPDGDGSIEMPPPPWEGPPPIWDGPQARLDFEALEAKPEE